MVLFTCSHPHYLKPFCHTHDFGTSLDDLCEILPPAPKFSAFRRFSSIEGIAVHDWQGQSSYPWLYFIGIHPQVFFFMFDMFIWLEFYFPLPQVINMIS